MFNFFLWWKRILGREGVKEGERERKVQGFERGRACPNLGKAGQIPLPRGTDPYNHLTLVLRPGEVMICSPSRLSRTQSCTHARLADNI